MLRIISALALAITVTSVAAQDNPTLVDNPPDRHIVVPGDTLWGIAGKFLKEPWRWPEIWRMNKEQVKNPHRIYPGNVIVLDLSSGKPQLKLASRTIETQKLLPQTYSEASRAAIPSIPASVIEPFISRPLIVEEKALEDVPRIVASQEDRVFMGHGDTAFITGIPDARHIDWCIYRPGKPLKDPESGEILGYEAFDLGTARLVQPGSPATVKIVTAREEIGRGDRLMPATKSGVVSYVPHAPEKAIDSRVVSIYGGLNETGQHSVITLNRGTRDGIEVGNVLALYRKRSSFGYDDNGKREQTQLPEERYGLVFVFRTFERISYALVMEAQKAVIVGDAGRNP